MRHGWEGNLLLAGIGAAQYVVIDELTAIVTVQA
jgi:hypothetical protein